MTEVTYFKPTLEAREAGIEARGFVKANMKTFWDLWKPLLPWIIGASVLDLAITTLFFANSEGGFGLFGALSGYFYAVLIISWHRVTIDGPDKFTPMSPFKPQRHEWVYIGVYAGLFIGLTLACVAVVLVTARMFGEIAAVLATFVFIIAGFFVGFRLCLYFPAKAINADITLKEAFAMSEGYLWKLLVASFHATIFVLLGMMGYMLAAGLVGGLTGGLIVSGDQAPGLGTIFFAYLLMMPVDLFFVPVMTVLGVTLLSNYYMLAGKKIVSAAPASTQSQ